jgi:hypothetical protein
MELGILGVHTRGAIFRKYGRGNTTETPLVILIKKHHETRKKKKR